MHTYSISTQRQEQSSFQMFIQKLSVETPSLRLLLTLRLKNSLSKDKVTLSDTRGWSLLSIKPTRRGDQSERSSLNSLKSILASRTMISSSLIDLNSKKLMGFGKHHSVLKQKKQWKTLEEPSLQTGSTDLPTKFWTSLFANVKEASMMHQTILFVHQTSSLPLGWPMNWPKQIHESSLTALLKRSSAKTYLRSPSRNQTISSWLT